MNKLSLFVWYLRWMQEQDLDVFIITSSPKGFGKSSFIIQTARLYLKTFGMRCKKCGYEWVYSGKVFGRDTFSYGNDFSTVHFSENCPRCNGSDVVAGVELDFMKYLAYDNEEVQERIFTLPPYSPLLGDEGVRFLMAEDWNKSENKAMKRLFAQMRTKHLIVFANIPKFKWIEGKYRDDMATFWVRVIVRGLVVVLQPDLGEADDSWHLDEFKKLLGSYFFFTPREVMVERIERLVRKHPCAFDYFSFPPVPEELYAKYLEARNKKAFERKKKEIVGSKDLAKIAAYNLRYRWDEIVEHVEKARGKRVTIKIMRELVFAHPLLGPTVGRETINSWVNALREMVEKKKLEEGSS